MMPTRQLNLQFGNVVDHAVRALAGPWWVGEGVGATVTHDSPNAAGFWSAFGLRSFPLFQASMRTILECYPVQDAPILHTICISPLEELVFLVVAKSTI